MANIIITANDDNGVTLVEADRLFIPVDLRVSSTSGDTINGAGSNIGIFCDGTIIGTNTGVFLIGTSNELTVGETGIITASGTGVQNIGTVRNAGRIFGDSVGIVLATNIYNTGVIESAGTAVSTGNGTTSRTLTNYGTVQSLTGNGNAYQANLGVGLSGLDIVKNFGLIIGNVILGAGGDDFDGAGGRHIGTVFGGLGIDVLRGGDYADNLNGEDDADLIEGRAGDDALYGGAGADKMFGGTGDDSLDGGIGADEMTGGSGNDTYFIDNVGDIAIETAVSNGSGVDAIISTFSLSLAPSSMLRGVFENLQLAGTALNATGNALANTLIGNNLNNTLNGLGGADHMIGVGGNDTYVVDNAGDQVDETISGAGVDTVRASVSFNLGNAANALGVVENLVLLGAAAISGTGNASNNVITGNAAANTLNGAAGNDTLVGGAGNDVLIGGLGNDTLNGAAGNDTFRFNAPLGATNIETIVGFSVPADTIQLDNAVMAALGAPGALAAAMFVANAAGTATTALHRIAYETDTGKLFYDSNGSAAGGRLQIAQLSAGLALTASDFVVI